jgi:SanA protein
VAGEPLVDDKPLRRGCACALPALRWASKTMIRTTGRKKILLLSAHAALLVMVAFSIIADVAIRRTEPHIYDSISDIPENDVGLVLGASRILSNGANNQHFENRMAAAAQLFMSGKVKHLLVSGDNHVQGYDEPTDMKNALVKLGVPPECITLDYAGFRTLDSVVRANKVFGQVKFTIISQRYHNYRALAIAHHHGLSAIAFCADDVQWKHSIRTEIREYFARTKAALDLFVLNAQPHFLGPHIEIDVKASRLPSPDA